MTQAQIATAQATEARKLAAKFETAQAIRKLLDGARKEYGLGWEDDDCEPRILDLVFSEEGE